MRFHLEQIANTSSYIIVFILLHLQKFENKKSGISRLINKFEIQLKLKCQKSKALFPTKTANSNLFLRIFYLLQGKVTQKKSYHRAIFVRHKIRIRDRSQTIGTNASFISLFSLTFVILFSFLHIGVAIKDLWKRPIDTLNKLYI